MLARENFDGPHVWNKPGLSGYVVCLVHLVVSCNQTNQTDRTDQMNKTGWQTVSASCQRGYISRCPWAM